MDYAADDPWNTPDMQRNHRHGPEQPSNGAAESGQKDFGRSPAEAPARTTSTFTTHTTDEDEDEPGRDPSRPSADSLPENGSVGGGNGGWGFLDGNPPSAAGGFGPSETAPLLPPQAANPFLGSGGSSPGQRGGARQSNIPGPSRTLGGAAGRTGSSVEETVLVVLMPEKEGIFLFQHHNYEVTSTRRASKVVRRYSDFVWLLDCLHKRYPFRVLPLLPPKRVAGR